MTQMALRTLGPEPWGARLARARRSAGFTTRQVEAALSPHLSQSTLVRLEGLEHEPVGRKDRSRTALLLALYSFDPAAFGLSDEDLPPAIDRRALRRLAVVRNRCSSYAA